MQVELTAHGLGGPTLGFLGGAAIGALSSGGARRRTTSSLSGSGTRGYWHRRRWGEFWAGERRRESVAGRYLGRYVSRAVHPARSLAHKAVARVQGAVGAARVKSAVARVSWAVRRNPQHGASALP